MKGSTRWARLGWHGISFDVPEDWAPGRLEGDFANGYLRVEDETSIRLELRWETAGRRLPAASTFVDNYLRQTRKKVRRKVGEPSVDRGRAIKGLEGVDHEAFTWRGGFNAHSLLLVAPESRRVVHLRLFFEEGRERKALARHIFGSVRAAARDGMNEWAVFGLRFEAPAAWRLEQSSLRTGCLQFLFRDGADELEMVRQSLAEMTLRKEGLDGWFRGFFAKALRGFGCTASACEYRGHPAVRWAGTLRLRVRPLGLFRPRRRLTALAWHCAEADKIFAVRGVTRVQGEPQVERCADSIACP